MLSSSSASALSKETFARLRHKLRAPLHQVISYAEIMVEDAGRQHDTKLLFHLGEVVAAADAALRDIDTYSSVCGNGSSSLEVFRKQLLDSYEEALKPIELLRSSANGETSDSLQSDLVKLNAAASAFRDAANTISLETVTERASQELPTTARVDLPEPSDTDVNKARGLFLIVDDNEANRDVLSRRLLRDGGEVLLAESGRQALRMAQRYDFDLILLDIMMPEMDGFSVLAELKKRPKLRHVPVIMISAVDEIESVVHCIEMGADDYLYKPFNPVLLRARIGALLERNRLRHEEERATEELRRTLLELQEQRRKSDELLLNILPQGVAEELQTHGRVEPRYFEDVTIVFADFVDFTLSTEQLPTEDLVHILNQYFTAFDGIMVRYGLEKLKTIGDCYMFAGGLPVRTPSHPVDAVLAALEMIKVAQEMGNSGPVNWRLRIGIHTGPVAAGVVGTRKFAFDVWGDTVNFGSRMESSSEPGRINLSPSTYARVKDFFSFEKREVLPIKDGRKVQMYFIKGIAPVFLDKQTPPLAAFEQRYRAYFQKTVKVPEALLSR